MLKHKTLTQYTITIKIGRVNELRANVKMWLVYFNYMSTSFVLTYNHQIAKLR